MGLSASTLFLMSTAATTIGTISSVRAQRAAIARENYRLETERRLAEVQALEEENARTEVGLQELANNLAYQSTAGYLDNSMSFININRQVKKNTEKDIANIRLMGKSTQNKFRQRLFENEYQSRQLLFGGYTSAAASLTSGFARSKYYKGSETV